MDRRILKKLYVVCIGAGSYDGITVGGVKALNESDIIVGYTVYCDLIKPYFPEKPFISTPMMQEIERCRIALQSASDGKITSMICSGDAGIYGMASPIPELADEYGVEVNIIAGVTAVCSGAALLGSPLTCDFTVISLSDLLSTMEVIEKRVECAAMSDICMVLYNPSSRKRSDYLLRCCDILLKYRSSEMVCGIMQNIGRCDERAEIMTLGELSEFSEDMFTTVVIGCSTAKTSMKK